MTKPAKQELTEWFPADVKPVHVGWYQASVSCQENGPALWWNGVEWDFLDFRGVAQIQDRYWRGLRSKP